MRVAFLGARYSQIYVGRSGAARFEDPPLAFAISAESEELAPAYVYFASEADSSYISGEVLAVLGAQTIAG